MVMVDNGGSWWCWLGRPFDNACRRGGFRTETDGPSCWGLVLGEPLQMAVGAIEGGTGVPGQGGGDGPGVLSNALRVGGFWAKKNKTMPERLGLGPIVALCGQLVLLWGHWDHSNNNLGR